MIHLPSLKTLLWVKQRRLDQLEKQVPLQLQQVRAAEAEVADARLQVCRGEEAACVASIDGLATSERFRPEHIVALGHVLQGLTDLTRQAVAGLEQAARRLAEAQQQLLTLRRAVQRASQQRDHLESRRRARLQEIDQEGEDTQDEESEEAAVARRVAQRHAQVRAASLE